MASTKAGGSAKNLTDSGPQYLGVKLGDGSPARPGMIIVRQRGTKIEPGKGVKVGKDHTIFAMRIGRVSFTNKRFRRFDGTVHRKRVANVI